MSIKHILFIERIAIYLLNTMAHYLIEILMTIIKNFIIYIFKEYRKIYELHISFNKNIDNTIIKKILSGKFIDKQLKTFIEGFLVSLIAALPYIIDNLK